MGHFILTLHFALWPADSLVLKCPLTETTRFETAAWQKIEWEYEICHFLDFAEFDSFECLEWEQVAVSTERVL